MSTSEIQEEEREVLSSIYDGDEKFKEISPNVFQYKYGENNDPKSFLLEIKWPENYPDEKPVINMDAFYNRHIVTTIKEKITNLLLDEAEQYLGMSMTYSLFEFLKEHFEVLMQEQAELVAESLEKLTVNDIQDEASKKDNKKEHLTKAQKRRQWDKVGSKGERPRGWNWVDIVKHLSQSGGKDESSTTS